MIVNLIVLALILCMIWAACRVKATRKMGMTAKGKGISLSVEATTSLRGFAIIIIALSHVVQYEPNISAVLWGGSKMKTVLFSGGAVGVSLFFLMSGYGCQIALEKQKKVISWTIKHIWKILSHFIFAFAVTAVMLIVLFKNQYSFGELAGDFLKLQILKTTTWYLKIQIQFYLIAMLSCIAYKRHSEVIVTVLSLGYAIVAAYVIELPDYWWKTSMCFAAGYIMARHRTKILNFVNNQKAAMPLFLAAMAVSYFLIMKDGHYRIYVQLPAYVCISVAMMLFWGKYVQESPVLKEIGKYTLDIYLVHIAIVESVFLLHFNLELKTSLFIMLTVLGTSCSVLASKKAYNETIKRFARRNFDED